MGVTHHVFFNCRNFENYFTQRILDLILPITNLLTLKTGFVFFCKPWQKGKGFFLHDDNLSDFLISISCWTNSLFLYINIFFCMTGSRFVRLPRENVPLQHHFSKCNRQVSFFFYAQDAFFSFSIPIFRSE